MICKAGIEPPPERMDEGRLFLNGNLLPSELLLLPLTLLSLHHQTELDLFLLDLLADLFLPFLIQHRRMNLF